MPEPLDFYFDFSSSYGFLMSEKIDALAARHGRKVRWHPFLLGVIWQAQGEVSPAGLPRFQYNIHDWERSARYLGIPCRNPSRFPIPTQHAARAYYWCHAQDCALARHFAHAIYRALFVDDRDISEMAVVLEIAASLGLDANALEAALKGPELKAKLKAACDEALAKGVFGSPYLIIDGEPFFGADRLPQIERWLETGGF